jgi:hypothetical protein
VAQPSWYQTHGLLKDLAVPETFLVAIDDLVVPDADAGVTVLEEPVGVVS